MIYPHWVCAECGGRYGRRPPGVACWNEGICDICNANAVPVTEPRDFGHLRDFPFRMRVVLANGEIREWAVRPSLPRALEYFDQALTKAGSGPIVSVQVRGMTFNRAPNGAFIRQENR